MPRSPMTRTSSRGPTPPNTKRAAAAAAPARLSTECMARIPPEVWKRIFDWATSYGCGDAEEEASLGTKLALVRVCKAWHKMALPCLYRHMVFRSLSAMQACLNHLIFLDVSSLNPSHSTRTLRLSEQILPPPSLNEDGQELTVEIDLDTTPLPHLLLFLPNLRAFITPATSSPHQRMMAGPRTLHALARGAGAGLTRLSTTLGVPARATLHLVRRLRGLVWLDVSTHWAPKENTGIAELEPLDLSALRDLEWDCKGFDELPALLDLLARSNFPALEETALFLSDLIPPMNELQAFFQAHGPRIKDLALGTHRTAVPPLISLCTRLTDLSVCSDNVPADLPSALHANLEQLRINTSTDPESRDNTERFVREIARAPPPRLRTIWLRSFVGKFTWRESESEVVAWVLRLVDILGERVALFDEDGVGFKRIVASA